MSGPGRIAFVTEGGPRVGLGHLSRCLALARAATADGARAGFLLPEDSRALSILRGAGFEAIPTPWRTEPGAALAAVEALGADTVVVDSYVASPRFLALLRPVAAQLVAVDDMADRQLPVDVVVNGGLSVEHLAYRREPGTTFLLGPRYALLDPAYAEAPRRKLADRPARILICLGGGLHGAAVAAALGAGRAALGHCVVDVVAGGAEDETGLEEAARGARVVVHRDRFGLRELMLAADLAVSGGGMTLYELAATATPAVTVQVAENQRRNAEAFERAGVALSAGAADEPGLRDSIESAVRRLAGHPAMRQEMGARGRELVDGQGAIRVARRLMHAAVSRSSG